MTPNRLYTSLPAHVYIYAHCLFCLLFYLLFQLHISFAIRLSGRKDAIKLIDWHQRNCCTSRGVVRSKMWAEQQDEPLKGGVGAEPIAESRGPGRSPTPTIKKTAGSASTQEHQLGKVGWTCPLQSSPCWRPCSPKVNVLCSGYNCDAIDRFIN